jgi:hypothetical protein
LDLLPSEYRFPQQFIMAKVTRFVLRLLFGLVLVVGITFACYRLGIPNAPANVGSYQFFSVLGLTLFGVDKTVAAGFSIAV